MLSSSLFVHVFIILSIFASFAVTNPNPIVLDNSVQEVPPIDVSNDLLPLVDPTASPVDESDISTSTSGTTDGISKEADAFDLSGVPITVPDTTAEINGEGETLDSSGEKVLGTLSEATVDCDNNPPSNRHRVRRDSICNFHHQSIEGAEGSPQKNPQKGNANQTPQNQNPQGQNPQNQNTGENDPQGAPGVEDTDGLNEDENKCPPDKYGVPNFPMCAKRKSPIKIHVSSRGIKFWMFLDARPCKFQCVFLISTRYYPIKKRKPQIAT